LRVEQFLTL